MNHLDDLLPEEQEKAQKKLIDLLRRALRERVAERFWQQVSHVVTPELRTDLEGLLTRAGTSRITNLERLRRAPSRDISRMME